MASSRNLQATLNWCAAFLGFLPLSIGGQEPALSTANIVLQTILGPPFCWRWNRGSLNFAITSAGGTDYALAAADFGFIENAWLVDSDAAVKPLSINNSLGQPGESDRPTVLAAQSDDNAGNITFRFGPKPDTTYQAFVDYQKKAPLLSSAASFWAPIPDEFSYIYDWGVLAIASILRNDPRFPIFNQKFVSHLLGAQQGLDEMARNIFLANWLDVMRAAQSTTLRTQQGVGARQV